MATRTINTKLALDVFSVKWNLCKRARKVVQEGR